jgi:hypothetical protein
MLWKIKRGVTFSLPVVVAAKQRDDKELWPMKTVTRYRK